MAEDPMAEIRATFFAECDDLLESLQDSLAEMDGEGTDPEIINTAFRAVHSIKGGGAAFGLDAMVGFAHQFEGALDALRSGELEATADTVQLCFRATDLLQDHMRAAREGTEPPVDESGIIDELEALAGHGDDDANVAFTPQLLSLDLDLGDLHGDGDDSGEDGNAENDVKAAGDGSARPTWLIRLAPQAGLYLSGNETLLILRALSSLGTAEVTCEIPSDLELSEDLAEVPRLSWTVRVSGDVTREEIDEIFDFVMDVCEISIEEAASQPVPQPATEAPAPEAPTLEAPTLAAIAPEPDPAPDMEPAAKPDMAPPEQPPAASDAPHPASPASEAPRPPAPRTRDQVTVRVALDRIDELADLVGELVINQAMLSQNIDRTGLVDTGVAAALETFTTLTRDIQDSIMSVRAQPVKPLFQRMARITREASAAAGKAVRLITEGEATEVDRIVIERLADPLTHMIRNSVDHGVEAADLRVERGKPAEGRITLSAAHSAGRVVIRLADDGGGINRPRVKEQAIRRGLIPEDAVLTDAETDELLFLPGFSTASEVSALSGRGVGMDVVKKSITSLGGRIATSSTPGRGTTFIISLPLTLAVLDGMVIEVGTETFVIPLSTILETIGLDATTLRQTSDNTRLLQFRDEFVPVIDLREYFGFPPSTDATLRRIVLLIARDDGNRTALIIDRIMEQRQVVIKGLGPLIRRMPGIAAATILGSGRIALILDPADLRSQPGPALSMPVAAPLPPLAG